MTLEIFAPPFDSRIYVSHGLTVGQRVRVTNIDAEGVIIAFGPAWHHGCTVKVRLDEGTGNMGDYHSCGSRYVEEVQ